jgi:hypothetical protein
VVIFEANHALLLGHVAEMACQSFARNVKQPRRTSLIAICLLVNESDAPLHSTRQQNIGAWLFVVVRERTSISSLARSEVVPRLIPKIFEICRDAEVTAPHKLDYRLQVVFLFSGDANLLILQLALHFESF